MSNFRAGQTVIMNSKCNDAYPGLRKEGPTRRAKFGLILKTTPGCDKPIPQPQHCIVLFEHRGLKDSVELPANFLEEYTPTESPRERAERKKEEEKSRKQKERLRKKSEKDSDEKGGEDSDEKEDSKVEKSEGEE